MKLSIIVVNYNTKKVTSKCIDSIYKHKINYDFEVILVDNASTDGSKEVFLGDKRIRFIQNTSNLGFAKANNIGMKKAKGEHFLLLNSDAFVLKDAINRLVEFADTNAKCGVVGPTLLNKDKTVQTSCYRLPTIIGAIRQYYFGERGILDKYAPTESTEVEAIVGAAFLVTKNAYEKVGDLDEKYFMYFEDIDYCRRVRELGLTVNYLHEAQVIHLHGTSGNTKTNELLISSSKKYFGIVRYYVYTFVLWSGQKMQKIFS